MPFWTHSVQAIDCPSSCTKIHSRPTPHVQARSIRMASKAQPAGAAAWRESVTFNAYINNVQNLTSTPDIHLTVVVCIHAQSCHFEHINGLHLNVFAEPSATGLLHETAVLQLVRKLPALYGNRVKTANYLSLFWARLVQSTSSSQFIYDPF